MIKTPTREYSFEYAGKQLHFLVRDELGCFKKNICDHLVLQETFEENTYALSEKDFNGSGVMVDIGGNIGSVSILSVLLGAKRVITYEPDPENYAMLMEHLKMNEIKCVEAKNLAVWGEAGSIPFVPSQGASTSREDALERHPDKIIRVPAITMERALAEVDEIDVLKCDIEGGEYQLFLNPELNKKARKIVIEYHKNTLDKFGAMVGTLVQTHNVQMFGNFTCGGGQILALRY